MGHMKDFDIRIRNGGDDAIAAVSELLPRWIPVGERLPEGVEEVLIYWIPRDDDGTPSCAGCDKHGGIIDLAWLERLGDEPPHWIASCEDKAGLSDPLFWMPLPEPPAIARDALRKQWDRMHKGPLPEPPPP